MSRQTTLHNWEVPVRGDTDYTETFDTLFDTLDNAVEIRDVAANRSDYNPDVDAKFVATDTGAVYIGDGSSWNRIAYGSNESLGTQSNPIPNTSHFESISTEDANIGDATLGATGIHEFNENVPDDGVASVTLNTGSALSYVSATTDGAVALFITEFDNLIDGLVGTNATNQGNSVLDGTTGPDGSLNISRDGNTFYFENRTATEEEISSIYFDR